MHFQDNLNKPTCNDKESINYILNSSITNTASKKNIFHNKKFQILDCIPVVTETHWNPSELKNSGFLSKVPFI